MSKMALLLELTQAVCDQSLIPHPVVNMDWRCLNAAEVAGFL
jgi:hypothetical protein